MGTHWGGVELCLPVEWHDVGIQACAQGLMRVRCPGLEQSGKGPAEAGRGGVDRHGGRDEPKGSHPPFVRDKDSEWWEALFRSENQHGSGSETIGDPPLHLPPMDFHLVEEPFSGCEQVSTI